MSNTLSAIYQGTSRSFTVTVSVDGVELDLTGDTCTLFVKNDYGDPDASALLTKSATVTSIATFELTASDTDIAPGTYRGEIRLDRANGEVHVVWINTFSIRRRVSDVV